MLFRSVRWRCGLSEADRHRLGAPPGWNCRDVQFFISRISFDQLGPERERALNAVETRFKLPPDQVELLIQAGRDGLMTNPKFRAFMTAGPRAPLPPAPAVPAPPPAGPPYIPPAPPVSMLDVPPHKTSAE